MSGELERGEAKLSWAWPYDVAMRHAAAEFQKGHGPEVVKAKPMAGDDGQMFCVVLHDHPGGVGLLSVVEEVRNHADH